MREYNTNGAFTTIKHEKLSPEEREQVKESRRMHIGEHAERSWEFEMKMFDLLKKLPGTPVSVANDASAMLREVMFWEIKAEHRDFWVYRVVRCKNCDPDPEKNCCWHKTGLSKRNVAAARELLVKLGLLEYTSGKGLPTGFHNRTHYRVNHAGLMDFLENPLPPDSSTADQHSRYERSNRVGTNGPTPTESTCRVDPISPTECTPDGETLKSNDKESHERQHDTSTSTTTAREPKPLSVGEEIARYTHKYMKECYGSGLTPVEFSALVRDTNKLFDHGFLDHSYRDPQVTPVYIEELYTVADLLVERVAFGADERAYPPREPKPLIVLAYEAWSHGYELTEI